MVARAGMGSVITRLREMTATGTADYTIGASTFWIDDQLQDALDRHSEKLKIQMSYITEFVGGATGAMDFMWGDEEVERAESGTAVWRVTDSSGSVIGTASYTVNYAARRIRFSTSQDGIRYLETVGFDMHGAAAEVWEDKASHVADRFDLQTDNHRLMRSQLTAQYKARADSHKKQRKSKQVNLSRSDSWW